MSEYIKVAWEHSSSEDPVLMYSELNESRWETRKVEVFRDGRVGYASEFESTCSTYLGKVPIPSLAEIAADSEFEPVKITAEEFEEVWTKRKDNL